ncbi:hypothetical protein EBT31_11825 [bacterium]|jgi:hypothetical protein|nr:hypothetical protein [bacterium]NBX50185.1 hypothetical protein [bacterium]
MQYEVALAAPAVCVFIAAWCFGWSIVFVCIYDTSIVGTFAASFAIGFVFSLTLTWLLECCASSCNVKWLLVRHLLYACIYVPSNALLGFVILFNQWPSNAETLSLCAIPAAVFVATACLAGMVFGCLAIYERRRWQNVETVSV